MKTIRIGTRGSRLAVVQTEMVQAALKELLPALQTNVCIIKTQGDILSDKPLDAIGGKGVFVKDIERQLLDGTIDIAVHSLKDMQAILPMGLTISAYLKRENPQDMIFTEKNHTLDSLPHGSTVGTSSMRRRCQIRSLRPDLRIIDIRGNVPTRLKKVGRSVDAVILAAAGVIRLDLPRGTPLAIQTMIPSPGQGIIAVQSRTDDALGQDCNLPAGAYATIDEHGISMVGMLGSTDETRMEKMIMTGRNPSFGRRLAQALMESIHVEPGQ